jgi:DNA-binding beta-propeller fold protein YncE
VYVSDTDNNTIYKITDRGPSAIASGSGPGGFSGPTSIAVDETGNVFVTDNGNAVIRKITPRGEIAVFAGKVGETGAKDGTGGDARFTTPRGIAIDPAGNLYVADEGNSNIRKITPAGVVTTLAGVAGSPGSQDGTGASAQFGAPRGLAVDATGNVYVADTDNHTIRKITPAGAVTTLAGLAGAGGNADGPGDNARFSEPRGVAADAAGNVFVADTGNAAIRQISPTRIVTTIAAAQPR